jgi:hypothetical protein
MRMKNGMEGHTLIFLTNKIRLGRSISILSALLLGSFLGGPLDGPLPLPVPLSRS